MSSIISDSLDFKWDTDHLNCGADVNNNFQPPQQIIYQSQPLQPSQPPQQTVCYSKPKSDSVVKLIQFVIMLAFIAGIAYFICGGNPDVLVSYINSGVNKISEVLSNVQI